MSTANACGGSPAICSGLSWRICSGVNDFTKSTGLSSVGPDVGEGVGVGVGVGDALGLGVGAAAGPGAGSGEGVAAIVIVTLAVADCAPEVAVTV